MNFSGIAVVKVFKPSNILPSPIYINPKMGIKVPPMSKPIAFIESETATAFKPPKMAYIPPIRPIAHTVIHKAATGPTPKDSGISNIVFIANAPEYNTVGSIDMP